MNPIYTATAHSSGDGRNGHVRSDEGPELRIPKEMGGRGATTRSSRRGLRRLPWR